MSYVFRPEAEAELLQAIDYYEQRSEGLGQAFAVEVYSAVQSIVQHPNAWPALEGEIRRRQTRRFPYGVVYSLRDGQVVILAVMHLHREPGYWKERLAPGD